MCCDRSGMDVALTTSRTRGCVVKLICSDPHLAAWHTSSQIAKLTTEALVSDEAAVKILGF